MTRDPVREALVSARTRAWLAYVDSTDAHPPNWQDKGPRFDAYEAYRSAADAVTEYDRTTPAASSDAGAQDKPLTENRYNERTD